MVQSVLVGLLAVARIHHRAESFEVNAAIGMPPQAGFEVFPQRMVLEPKGLGRGDFLFPATSKHYIVVENRMQQIV